jgi:hypothetical protein
MKTTSIMSESIRLKPAEDWASELIELSEKQGGIDSEQCLVPIVQEIRAEVLENVRKYVQEQREDGEADLRSILYHLKWLAGPQTP